MVNTTRDIQRPVSATLPYGDDVPRLVSNNLLKSEMITSHGIVSSWIEIKQRELGDLSISYQCYQLIK